MRSNALVVQKSPEILVRKESAVLTGLAAKSQIGKCLPEIPGILDMPGIWLESQYRFYVFCQS
ncbi:hypothetical protein CKA32_003643 [Geitlerinema sp. FC II]|nr:hypothetical protein CKA32_003643 [Geitlerinema sp. FC II]